MIYLVNAPKRGASKRRGKAAPKKRTKAKARRSSSPLSKTRRKGAQMAAKKRRKRRVTARRASPRRKRRVTSRKPGITVRRRGQVVYQGNPRRKRRSTRRFRRNPGGGILGSVMRSGQDALAILGGMAATNIIARRIPFGEGNRAIEIAKKIAVAVGLGMVAQKVASRSVAEKVTVGGMVAVGADLLRNVPMVGTALAGDDDLRMLARSGMGAYANTPMLESAGLASWPQPGVEQAGGLSSYYN